MKTRLVIMQDLIARRKALRSKEIDVCPAKGSGQQARALRGSRGETSTLNSQASVPGGTRLPARGLKCCREMQRGQWGERLSTSRAAATAHAGAAQNQTCRHPAMRCHERWSLRSRPCDCTRVQRSAPFSQRLLSAGCAPLGASAPGAARTCTARRALWLSCGSAAGPRACTAAQSRGAAGRRRTQSSGRCTLRTSASGWEECGERSRKAVQTALTVWSR